MARALPPVAVRNPSIDAFRVVANWAIICVHTTPFIASAFRPDVQFFGEMLNQFVRVSTPFFFLTSGYFFAASLSRGAAAIPHALNLIKRLMLFFVFWSIVYVLVPIDSMLKNPDVGYWSAVLAMVRSAISMRSGLLLMGTNVHLWFLPALGCSLVLLAAACRLRLERPLMVFSIALFVFGLIAGAYKVTPIGLELGINTRNGLFFGTIFVVSGFMLHRLGKPIVVYQALSLIALGIALRIIELSWITRTSSNPLSNIDYVLGTYPFGIGIFTLLLATNWLGQVGWMVRLSRYSPGIYCAHMLAVEFLRVFPPAPEIAWWEIVRPFVALALTAALVISLARVPILRPVVT